MSDIRDLRLSYIETGINHSVVDVAKLVLGGALLLQKNKQRKNTPEDDEEDSGDDFDKEKDRD